MAAKKETAAAAVNPDKKKAIETAMQQIEKMYGKGSIMRYGDGNVANVEAIPTGSLSRQPCRQRIFFLVNKNSFSPWAAGGLTMTISGSGRSIFRNQGQKREQSRNHPFLPGRLVIG